MVSNLSAGRTVLVNTRWMDRYAGSEVDVPPTTFGFPRRTGSEGAERYNFFDIDGRCYAYVPFNRKLNLSKLGASDGADSIGGVTVAFTATKPGGGSYLVGWFENATLYSSGVVRPTVNSVHCKAVADSGGCYLIDQEDRDFQLPRGGPDQPGSAAIFYLSTNDQQLEVRVLAEISRRKAKGLQPVSQGAGDPSDAFPSGRSPRQRDATIRLAVERAAVNLVGAYYSDPASRGSQEAPDPWRSVERDNVGWDIETQSGLRVEVKGRLSRSFVAELTPNEFLAFVAAETDPALAATYRLAIVAGALEPNPDLAIFAFSDGGWICVLTGRRLGYDRLEGARVDLERSTPTPPPKRLPPTRKVRRRR